MLNTLAAVEYKFHWAHKTDLNAKFHIKIKRPKTGLLFCDTLYVSVIKL